MIRRLWLVLCGSVTLLVGLLASVGGAQAAGQLAGFGSVGTPATQFFGVAAQRDGRIVAAGEAGTGADARLLVARFNANGTLDTSFGSGGIALAPLSFTGTVGRAVAVDSSGNILVAGQLTNGTADDGMLLERFTSAGRLDGGFGSGGAAVALVTQGGAAFSIALQGDGKIVLGGSGGPAPGQNETALARFTASGAADMSFGGTGGAPAGSALQNLGEFSVANGVAVDASGRIVIAGSTRPGLQVLNGLAARFNPNGTLDTSFGSGGAFVQFPSGTSGSVAFQAIALQGSNIVLGGVTPVISGSVAIVARLTAGGQPDPSFNGGNPVALGATAPAVTQTPPSPYPGIYGLAIDGSDIIAGGFIIDNAQHQEPALFALGSSGALDPGFGSGGFSFTSTSPYDTELGAIAVSPADGGVVAAGAATLGTAPPTGIITRYSGQGNPNPPNPPNPPKPNPPKPNPTPHPQPFKQPSLSLNRSYFLAGVLRSGLSLKVTCHAPCSIRSQITLANGTARRLGLISRRSRNHRRFVIGHSTRTLGRGGFVTVKIFLSGNARRRLGHQRSVRISLSVLIQSGSHRTTKNRSILLRQQPPRRKPPHRRR